MLLLSLPPEILRDIFGHLQRPLPLDGAAWARPRWGRSNEDAADFRTDINTLQSLCLVSKAISTIATPVLYTNIEKSRFLRAHIFRARVQHTAYEAELSHRLSPFASTTRLDFGCLAHSTMLDAIEILAAMPHVSVLILPPMNDERFDTDVAVLEVALRRMRSLRKLRIDLVGCNMLSLSRLYTTLWQLPLDGLELEMPKKPDVAPTQNLVHGPSDLEHLCIRVFHCSQCEYIFGSVRLEILQNLRFECPIEDMDYFLSHMANLQPSQLRFLGLAVLERQHERLVGYKPPTFEALPLLLSVTHFELSEVDAQPITVGNLLGNLPPSVQFLVWQDPRAGDLRVLASLMTEAYYFGSAPFHKPHLRYIMREGGEEGHTMINSNIGREYCY